MIGSNASFNACPRANSDRALLGERPMTPLRSMLLAGFALFGVGATQESPAPANPANEAALSQLPPGYLPRDSLPDSLALLPPPPAEGSAALERDEEARRSVSGMSGSPRWQRAASDADLAFPHAAGTFSCAAGVPLGPETTPQTYALLGKMFIDVGLSTYGAKNQYHRTRPFVVHAGPTCSPADEAMLRNDGSYPSGHSAVGWGWALVLAELVPERADAIVQRGRDFGQSRLVCNVHWQSDIDAGRVIASATVARLHADQAFRSDLEDARAELVAVRVAGKRPATDCAAEAASLRSPG
jgi:acid phosphatase (class A)